MNHRLFNYFVLLTFSFFHFNLSASEVNYIYKNKSGSEFNVKEIFFLNHTSFLSDKITFGKESETIFFAEQEIFSIRAEVNNNGCFTGNSNNVTVKFIVKNITNINQQIIGRTDGSGNKLQLVTSSGCTIQGFSGTSNLLTTGITLSPNSELTINGTFYNAGYLTVQEVLASVKFKYANFQYANLSNSQIGEVFRL